MANKKKTTTAIVAGVTAAALLLGGTFAWTSISQQAKNESAGIVNVGGRLHDDFDGENKDIYVENFTDPLNGGQPIYARIKLTEYMEVGQDAGGVDDGDGVNEVVPVIDGTDINDVETWKTFIPESITDTAITCADCVANNGECTIHNHWKWTVGGQTSYMPTFNKDKDSLTADINGTYHGTNLTDKVYYDDYVVYTTEDTGAKDVLFAEKEQTEGEIYSVVGTAYYDDDTDTDENDHDTPFGVRTENETHTAKSTVNATVITMEEWLANQEAGNFWVYDEDGWAYWANPIMPGESTGLLLDGIEMFKNPGEKCYYSINVVAEFATVGDWEYFTGFNEADNANALNLLQAASGNVTTVTVTNNDKTTLMRGESTTFTATATKASDAATAAVDEFEWYVYDAELNLVDSSTIVGGVLTIGENETNSNLIVAAKHIDSGAVGMASVAVKQTDKTAPTVSVVNVSTAQQTITISNVDTDDYPLTVKLYELETEAALRSEECLVSTVTVTNTDGEVAYTESATNERIQNLSVLDTGEVVLTSNFVPSNSVGSYLGVTVMDAAESESEAAALYVAYPQGCFVAGTQVQTADGLVNVEDIKVGDLVYSIDLTTGEKVVQPVTWVQEDIYANAVYTVYAGGEEITVTAKHPVYVIDKEWVTVENLSVGDKLLDMNGNAVEITNIVYTELDEPVQVYNFTVDGAHNYLITDSGLLVHNK